MIVTVGIPVGPTTTLVLNVLPRDRDRLVRRNKSLVRKLGMKLHRAPAGQLDAILQTHVAKSDRILVVVVKAGERSVLREIVVRRIPHLRDRIGRVTNAAVDLVRIVFPETPVRLPAELASRIVNTCR